jgi:hypothetical protein
MSRHCKPRPWDQVTLCTECGRTRHASPTNLTASKLHKPAGPPQCRVPRSAKSWCYEEAVQRRGTMNRRGSLGPIGGFMRRFGAPFRICLPVWAVLAPWAPTRRGAELRTILLVACAGLVMSITGCLSASAATRHIVLLFDERVELPGLSLLEAEFVHTLRFDATEPVEVYREAMDLSRFNSDLQDTSARLPPCQICGQEDRRRSRHHGTGPRFPDDVWRSDLSRGISCVLRVGQKTTWCSLPPSEHVRCPDQERVCTDTRTRASPPSRDRRRGGRFRNVRFRRRTSCAGPSRFPSVREPGLVYLPFRTPSRTNSCATFTIAFAYRRLLHHDVSRRQRSAIRSARRR